MVCCFSNGIDPLPFHRLSGSESDVSDTEASGAVSNLQGQQARVRQHSLAALFAVVKVSKITFKLLPILALVLVDTR